MRDSVIFYRSFYEAISELESDVQAKIYTAIFEYSLNFKEVELSGLPKTIFTLIKPQLDANNKRYKSGAKGGRPNRKETEEKPKGNQRETKEEPKDNQDETKSEANVNVNGNENVNVNGNEKLKVNPNEKTIGVCVSKISNYFSFTEINDFKKYRDATQFCTLLNTNGQLEKFKEQLAAYIEFKERTGEKRHRFANFLGTPQEKYMDGGWNAANWVDELERTPDKTSGSYVDDFKSQMAKI